MMANGPRGIATVMLVVLLALAHRARADDSARSIEAERLFADGTALMAKELFGEACPLLEEAQRLDPGIGTQFNLATCYERSGRLAAAYRNFTEVVALAHAAGKTAREES